MRYSFLLIAFYSCIAPAADEDLAKCGAISDGARRLGCYDAVAQKRGATMTTVIHQGNGKWKVEEGTSPIDDSKLFVVSLKAEAPIQDKFSRLVVPTLVLRCQQKRTEAYINFSEFLGSDRTMVLTRYDSDKAQTQSWLISTDHEAVFFPSAIAAIRQMGQKQKLLVQLTPYGENPVMTTFDLNGANAATTGIRESCSWK